MNHPFQLLDLIERTNGIRILFASEAGSRAWGISKNDSDYDIRFIYIHENVLDYFSINTPSKSIDGFSEDRAYDWQGWELSKAIAHLREMNPSIMEWLYSPIVYRDLEEPRKFSTTALSLVENCEPSALIKHYYSMAKKNFMTFVDGRDVVSLKKYLYVIRNTALISWIENVSHIQKRPIEMNFLALFDHLHVFLGDKIYHAVIKLIKQRQNSVDDPQISRIPEVDSWIDSEIISVSFKDKFEHINKTDKISDHECNEILKFYYLHQWRKLDI